MALKSASRDPTAHRGNQGLETLSALTKVSRGERKLFPINAKLTLLSSAFFETTITLTSLRADFANARAALTCALALLQGWAAQAAEQLNPQAVWHRLCDHLKHILAGIGPTRILSLLANHPNGSD